MPGSESGITTINKTTESQNPECEQTLHSAEEKGSESGKKDRQEAENPQTGKDAEASIGTWEPNPKEMERPSEQGQEQTLVTTMTTAPPFVQPLAVDREGSKVESMSGSNILITSEVKVDNTVISVGDYSFHTKSKVVMRK